MQFSPEFNTLKKMAGRIARNGSEWHKENLKKEKSRRYRQDLLALTLI